MFWMMLIMLLPIFGVALFFTMPLSAAIPLYLTLLVIAGLYHCLMIGAIRLPSQMGPEKMIGSRTSVRNWEGNSGQVVWNGEIWRARERNGSSLSETDDVIIDGRCGLTLLVKRAEETQAAGHGRHAAADECVVDRLLVFPRRVGRLFELRTIEKIFARPHRMEKLAR